MAATASTVRTATRSSRPAASAWSEAGVELSSPEALQLAFHTFSQLSDELSGAYQALQVRVEQLTHEVEQANHQRLHEISEKERIASRLENLLQLLPGGVVVLNSQGQVSESNAAARELLDGPLEGRFWRDIIRECFAPRSDDGHEISLRNSRRVSLATRSLDDEPGQIILLTDQTETRRLQQHLSRHQRLSAMGKMVSSLAHQIRTPLSAAMLYAGQIDHPDITGEQRTRCASRLKSRLDNMERQVKDMLLFARGDAILDETLAVETLFNEIRIAAEVVLRSSFSCQWRNEAGQVTLRCNREALVSAVLNLIENALHATGPGAHLQIVAELLTVEGAQPTLWLYVEDNGPGIPAELLEQITEAFFTTRPQGTGLGLAVAQVVAKAHRGRFHIESQVAPASVTGTRAGFLLPVIQGNSTAQGDAQPSIGNSEDDRGSV